MASACGSAFGAVGKGWLPPLKLFTGPPAKLQGTLRGMEGYLAACGSVFMLEMVANISFSAAAWRSQSIRGRELNWVGIDIQKAVLSLKIQPR